MLFKDIQKFSAMIRFIYIENTHLEHRTYWRWYTKLHFNAKLRSFNDRMSTFPTTLLKEFLLSIISQGSEIIHLSKNISSYFVLKMRCKKILAKRHLLVGTRVPGHVLKRNLNKYAHLSKKKATSWNYDKSLSNTTDGGFLQNAFQNTAQNI